MIKCYEIRELISGYIDGMLEETEYEMVNAHLQSCSECQGLHQDLLGRTAQLSGLDDLELPQGFHNRLMNKLQAEAPSPKGQIHWKRLALAAATAAVLLFSIRLFGEGGLLIQEGPPQNQERKIASDSEFRAAEEPDAQTGDEPGIASLPEAEFSRAAPIIRKSLHTQEGTVSLGDLQALAQDLGIEILESAEQSILLFIPDQLTGETLYEQLEMRGTLDPHPGAFDGEFQPFYLFIILLQ